MINFPRIIIAALKGGAGKTILTLGLTAAWLKKGIRVMPFKKGPDFIDAGWLALAADRSCYNLDSFMMSDKQIIKSFLTRSTGADVSLIEGNRGLFDGLDSDGCCSTAELGKLLKTPVIIVVDVTMATRTIAAIVLGCQKFDTGLNIAAVILNRVAGARQESVIRKSIEQYCGIPVIGVIPKLKGGFFPERHMGLVPCQEREHAVKAIEWARSAVEENLDLGEVWRLARNVEPLEMKGQKNKEESLIISNNDPPRIGFIRDKSFWFYYPENLEQLKKLGGDLVEINSMEDRDISGIDALYIGGGFPETQAKVLADNVSFREALKQRIEAGLPVYAECGGLMYLGECLIINEKIYPMAGVLPIKFILEEKPQGHGYTILEVTGENLYFKTGEILKGHEFHYSRALLTDSEDITTVFRVLRGQGLDGKRDGLCKKNLLATYTHLHAEGNSLWAESFFNAAVHQKSLKYIKLKSGEC